MVMYQYVKAQPRYRRTARPAAVSWVLMTAGVLILLWSGWAIVSFSLVQGRLLGRTVSPLAEQSVTSQLVGSVSPLVEAGSQVVLGEAFASTNPNVWFPTSPQKRVVSPVNSYKVSIPKLKIKDATVVIAGDDLQKSLVHYGGTGLPGQYGNAVIFGHSTLPQFYSPTNYKSIFSLLPTLAEGDEIFVSYDGISYRYVIDDMTITEPNDLSPLEQRFDDSYLTLITCVPPGTYWQRLNVKARLMQS